MLKAAYEQAMRAVVMTAPGRYAIDRIPVPAPGPGEALVRMRTVAICGSDPGLLAGRSRKDGLPPGYPFVPGHEGVGEIVALGTGTQGFQPGDRVATEAHLGCGACRNCREGRYNLCLNFGRPESGHRQYGFTAQGCYAEFACYHTRALHRIPDAVPDEAAALTDTFATGLHAARLTGIRPGGTSAIIGCGPVGLGLAGIARALGSRVLAVGSAVRAARALEMGAEAILDFRAGITPADWIRQMTGGLGADQTFDCAGTADSLSAALLGVRRGGKAGLVAVAAEEILPLPVKRIMWDELSVIGSRGNPHAHDDVLSMLAAGTLRPGPLITHRFPLDAFPEAVDTFVRRKDDAIKVLIQI